MNSAIDAHITTAATVTESRGLCGRLVLFTIAPHGNEATFRHCFVGMNGAEASRRGSIRASTQQLWYFAHLPDTARESFAGMSETVRSTWLVLSRI